MINLDLFPGSGNKDFLRSSVKKAIVPCILLSFWFCFTGQTTLAMDVGWMQKGVRVWYFGGVGSTSSSDAEVAYLFTAVNGTDVQVTKHSGLNHWGTTQPVDVSTYSFLDKGPCWIHPQRLQTLAAGDNWMGFEITLATRAVYTYDTLPYRLLPAKALFDLKAGREVVKVNYMIPGFSTGMAYFDAETGLCLFYSQLNGYVTVFFVLSEINYDFAARQAFAEDDGPHTGFKSFVSEASLGWSFGVGGGTVVIQSSVESRYGSTLEMWVSTSDSGPKSSYLPPFENYCFFGNVPIVRRMAMSEAPKYPPDQWNEYGRYLWWWIPQATLEHSTINVFGVPMTRTAISPYVFTAVGQKEGLFFNKLWLGDDGYVTAFSAKDSTTGLDIDPGQTIYFQNLTKVEGLAYFRNTMKQAIPTRAASLTLTKSGSGSGAITSSPSGINCGPTCFASFNAGASITLTATPDGGSYFYGWSAPCTGNGLCTFCLDADAEIVASFNPAGYPFVDVAPGSWAEAYINALYYAHITTGYGGTNEFKPDLEMTREQMAGFIVRTKSGEPPDNYCAMGSPFTDVAPASWSCKYIKKLFDLGLTTGYGGSDRFRPELILTREQMAAIIIRALEGEPSAAYCDSGSPFTDVPTTSWSCKYIKRLYEKGITTGYGGTSEYKPLLTVTRAQMATFIGRAFLGVR